MKVTSDVVVTSVEGYVVPGRRGSDVITPVLVQAGPFNSSNLVDQLRFTALASNAPRVGEILSVTVESKEERNV